jgi:hypothetical protein
VQLVEVDPVGAQPAQAVLDGLLDPLPPGAALRRVVADLVAELGGDDGLVAAAAERAPSISSDRVPP